jgi:hypothetical protein
MGKELAYNTEEFTGEENKQRQKEKFLKQLNIHLFNKSTKERKFIIWALVITMQRKTKL